MSGDQNIRLLRWSSLLMNDLMMWLGWHCEKLTRDKLLPWDAMLSQLMYDHKLDQAIMIKAPILLCWAFSIFGRETKEKL